MARSDRLFEIIQILRSASKPVTARTLSQKLEVSERTIYRDMVTLAGQRVPIDGEAGIGYMMRGGFDLPPLMFTAEEIEALVVGAGLVKGTGDNALAVAADVAATKIEAVLPADLKEQLTKTALFVVPSSKMPAPEIDLGEVRASIRDEAKLLISYTDGNGTLTRRTIWPLAVSYFTDSTIIVAWCEMRDGFRHFRADRIHELAALPDRFDGRRGQLLRTWFDQREAL
ncbi:MAG: YafY family protein [Alphaproteobacteria bacterium]|nr:YafY family protein [Alphaproteobacteria bacterium]